MKYNTPSKLLIEGNLDSVDAAKRILERTLEHGNTGHSFEIAAVDGKTIEKTLGGWDGDGGASLKIGEIITEKEKETSSVSNKIFFDTEFYENGETINFISIGCIKENGGQLYLVNKDFDYDWFIEDATKRGQQETIQFLNDNVFNNLNSNKYNTFDMNTIKKLLMSYVGPSPTFYTSTGSYDWVLLMQSFFGRMLNKPKDWPYMPVDTAQFKYMMPDVNKDLSLFPFTWPKDSEHNALFDACEVYAKYLSYKKYIEENNLSISI